MTRRVRRSLCQRQSFKLSRGLILARCICRVLTVHSPCTTEAPEEEYDPRSLFERLQEQKDKKQEEYEEQFKFSKCSCCSPPIFISLFISKTDLSDDIHHTVSGGLPLPSLFDLILGFICHRLCKNMRVLAYTCAGVCLSMSVGVYKCEQMGVMEIKSRSVLAGADGRLA